MNRKVSRALLAMLILCWAGHLAPAPAAKAKKKPVKLDVPYVPTNPQVVEKMLELGKVTSKDYVIDLGCGDGRIVIAAAKKYKARAYGVDLDPQRVRESNANAKKARVTKLVKFKTGDALKEDVSKASVVTLFLLNSVNLRLRPNLLAQLKPGSRVVSHAFHMADWKADKTVRHKKAYGKVMYLWTVPAPVGGTWRWQTKTPGRQIANSMTLQQKFQVVSGAVQFPGSGSAAITKPSLTGTKLSFTAAPRIGKENVNIVYEGTVTGDTIQGTQKWTGGPAAGTYPWAAKRDRVEITGRWRITAPGHPRHSGTLSIRREDNRLAATYVREREPKKKLALPALYVWGSSIRFEIPLRTVPLIFTGSLTADAGEGTVHKSVKKQTKWTAKRLAGQ